MSGGIGRRGRPRQTPRCPQGHRLGGGGSRGRGRGGGRAGAGAAGLVPEQAALGEGGEGTSCDVGRRRGQGPGVARRHDGAAGPGADAGSEDVPLEEDGCLGAPLGPSVRPRRAPGRRGREPARREELEIREAPRQHARSSGAYQADGENPGGGACTDRLAAWCLAATLHGRFLWHGFRSRSEDGLPQGGRTRQRAIVHSWTFGHANLVPSLGVGTPRPGWQPHRLVVQDCHHGLLLLHRGCRDRLPAPALRRALRRPRAPERGVVLDHQLGARAGSSRGRGQGWPA
mmetsp:Transcript_84266/g.214533  ORF Transcript_84266/g.214533 Transcript_84266/m.214533 type:complete len:287 (+) Transcript_84266:117-977(+)